MMLEMRPWLRRLAEGALALAVVLLLLFGALAISDELGWESRGARRALFAGLILVIVAIWLVGSEIPALKRRLREGKAPAPRHKWHWPER
jgi:hypothetical protein